MELCIEKKQRQWSEKKLVNLLIMHTFRKRKLIYYYSTDNHTIFLEYYKLVGRLQEYPPLINSIEVKIGRKLNLIHSLPIPKEEILHCYILL